MENKMKDMILGIEDLFYKINNSNNSKKINLYIQEMLELCTDEEYITEIFDIINENPVSRKTENIFIEKCIKLKSTILEDDNFIYLCTSKQKEESKEAIEIYKEESQEEN
jgi:hypothetical protein